MIRAIIWAMFSQLALSGSARAIPQAAWDYQRQIVRAGWVYHDTDNLASTMAAQIHQESYWDPSAQSWVGATGLTQFMPATARDESRRCGLGLASPLDPAWAIQAQHCYMARLIKRNYEFATGCERIAAGLSGYNGGQGNVNRQRRKWAAAEAKPAGIDVDWFGGVENYRVRGRSAHTENRGYPRRILLTLTPQYVAAGYGGIDVCKTLN